MTRKEIIAVLSKYTCGEGISKVVKEAHSQAIEIIEDISRLERVEKFTRQTLDDMSNPLEPLKVYSALQSEIMKYQIRQETNPKSISELDYTIIIALKKVLDEVSENADM